MAGGGNNRSATIPALLERTLTHLAHAHAVGLEAVTRATEHLRDRLDGDASAQVAPAPLDSRDVDTALSADQLALSDYDTLAATHVVASLATLSEAERDLIAEYERTHRGRRTVLGKIDQLRHA